MLKKVIIFLMLLCIPAMVLAASEQSTGLTFVGIIEEIASKTTTGPVGAMEKYLSIKLDSKPKLDFRVTNRDAASFRLIDTDQPSAVLAPGKLKGLGWKVRLTCDKKTTMNEPYYLVTKLERLD